MIGNMSRYKLRDLLSIQNGKDYRNLNHGDIPVYGTGGIIAHVNTFLSDRESILLPRKGTLNNIMYVSGKFWTVDTMYWTKINENLAYPKYLFYYLSLLDLSARDSGSTLPSMTFESYYTIDIDLPPLEKQKDIADRIFKINQNIENNNSIINNLESIAKTIYDYWFLQFEFPNEEGKPYKSSGGKMVWNAELKREIPEGWEAKQIKDIATTNRGISYTAKDLADIGTPILSLASVSRTGAYIPEGIKYFCGEVPSSKELKPYDLIMCNTDMTQQREVIARCIMVPDIFENVITHTHHITKVSLNDDSYNSYFCSTTQSSWFHEYVKGFSSGTNVLGLDAKAFDKIWLPVPDKNTAEKYNKTFMKLQKDKSNLLKQNQELASLRDFLLPMLMNGQITFKDN